MISFEIVTPANVTSRTFDNVTDARKYVLSHKHDLPGLRIDRVEVVTLRESVYRPRASRSA